MSRSTKGNYKEGSLSRIISRSATNSATNLNMVNCHRMGIMEEHLERNAMLIASLRYQLRDLWRSPRGMVLRIEALALVAISLSFFLALFGSCRRWSNRWIVQKGFLAAQVLSLSLGTYSIGLMQSSPVKSEMYPIWAVSLLTLFGCVDPVTAYFGLDYKGPLSKMIFQLCLYFGYVMLMSVSTISSDVGKLAIVLLSTITFIKGFHRALAFVLPGEIREDITIGWLDATEPAALAGDSERLKVHLRMYLVGILERISKSDLATMADIQKLSLPKGTPVNGMTITDVCLSYSFSHLLRRRFLGLDTPREIEMEEKLMAFERLVRDGHLTTIHYERTLKVVEVELAFLFEAFFTSNEFLHFYQAKTGSFWAFASFLGICFVGVVAAIVPGAMASHHCIINDSAAAGGGGDGGAGTCVSINNVGTTAWDLIITLVILVSLALLQLVQLIRCWTSNWARVGIACEYAIKAKNSKKQMSPDEGQSVVVVVTEGEFDSSSNTASSSSSNQIISRCVMGLRLFLVARVNWFDRYLWQEKLGQDSVAALLQRRRTQRGRESVLGMACCCCCPWICVRWLSRVGVQYVCGALHALLLSDTTNPGGVVRLHDDVKASIAEFLGTIKSRRIEVEWSALFLENGLQDWLEYLPYTNTRSVPIRMHSDESSVAYTFTRRVMIWHIATWYCEEAEKAAGGNRAEGGEDSRSNRSREKKKKKNRRVAMDLSKYCAYLVVSAPELLPGPAAETKKALERALWETEYALSRESNTITMLEVMQQQRVSSLPTDDDATVIEFEFVKGVHLGKRLRNEAMMPLTPPDEGPGRRNGEEEEEGEQSTRPPFCSADHWELLALVWVQTLLYAAPYGDVQAHMQRLALGGEFITHLWALLYHLGIDKWEVAGINELKAGTAAAETAREVQAQAGESEIEEIN